MTKEEQAKKSRLWRLNNPEKVLAQQRRARESYKNPKEKERRRNLHLIKTYGMSLEDYDKMLLGQGGVCAICRNRNTGIRDGKPIHLSVDHNHNTGKVRGILCYKCNASLGGFDDSVEIIENAIAYLVKYGKDYLIEKAGLND